MAANYLQGCDAVLVVFDITRQEVRSSLRQRACLSSAARLTCREAAAPVCMSCLTLDEDRCGDGVLSARPARLQTYATACQWAGIVEQMFCETGVPLVAVAANKADSQDLQAAAAGLAVPMMASAGACFRSEDAMLP